MKENIKIQIQIQYTKFNIKIQYKNSNSNFKNNLETSNDWRGSCNLPHKFHLYLSFKFEKSASPDNLRKLLLIKRIGMLRLLDLISLALVAGSER